MARFAVYVVRRAIGAIPVLFGAIVLTFVLMRLLPGDPAILFASSPFASEDEIAAIRREMRLDRPVVEQFIAYIGDLSGGRLGRSLVTGQPVTSDLAQRLPATIELCVAAFALVVMFAVPLGVIAAVREGSVWDHAARIISAAGVSMPAFVTGIILIYIFYYILGWAPDPTGRINPSVLASPPVTGFLLLDSLIAREAEVFMAACKQLALPAVSMALFATGPVARMTRASMLGILGSDFIRTAESLGLPRKRIIVGYALRNAAVPIVTTLGIVLSFMLGANVLIEKVFAWPGIGSYALDALAASDYAAIQGFVLLMVLTFILLNLVIDILYAAIDPRINVAK